jgi:hypothetical protein
VLVTRGWVVGLGSEDEISGDELGTLVKELVEGVLGVGGRLAEKDGAGCVFYHLAIARYSLSVRFHRELLKVGGESVEVLIEARVVG